LDFLCVDVRELVAAKERDALCKDLDHEDGRIGQDILLVVENAVVAHDVCHTHCSLDDEGNDTHEDMVAEDRMDGCNITDVLVVLQMEL